MVLNEKAALEAEPPEIGEKVLEVRNAIHDSIHDDPGDSPEEWLHKIRDEPLPQIHAPNPLLQGKKDSEKLTGMASGSTPYVAFEVNEREKNTDVTVDTVKQFKDYIENTETVNKPAQDEDLASTAASVQRPSMCEFATGTDYYERNYQECCKTFLNTESMMSRDPAENGLTCEVATTDLNPPYCKPPVDRSGFAPENNSEELAAMCVTGRALVPRIPREVRKRQKKAKSIKKEFVLEEEDKKTIAHSEQKSGQDVNNNDGVKQDLKQTTTGRNEQSTDTFSRRTYVRCQLVHNGKVFPPDYHYVRDKPILQLSGSFINHAPLLSLRLRHDTPSAAESTSNHTGAFYIFLKWALYGSGAIRNAKLSETKQVDPVSKPADCYVDLTFNTVMEPVLTHVEFPPSYFEEEALTLVRELKAISKESTFKFRLHWTNTAAPAKNPLPTPNIMSLLTYITQTDVKHPWGAYCRDDKPLIKWNLQPDRQQLLNDGQLMFHGKVGTYMNIEEWQIMNANPIKTIHMAEEARCAVHLSDMIPKLQVRAIEDMATTCFEKWHPLLLNQSFDQLTTGVFDGCDLSDEDVSALTDSYLATQGDRTGPMVLRHEQAQALCLLKTQLYHAQMIIRPTGSGKSTVGAAIAHLCADAGMMVLIVTETQLAADSIYDILKYSTRHDEMDCRYPLRLHLGTKELEGPRDIFGIVSAIENNHLSKQSLANRSIVVTTVKNCFSQVMRSTFAKNIDPKKGIVVVLDQAELVTDGSLAAILTQIIDQERISNEFNGINPINSVIMLGNPHGPGIQNEFSEYVEFDITHNAFSRLCDGSFPVTRLSGPD